MRVSHRKFGWLALGGTAFFMAGCANPWAEHAQSADQIFMSGWVEDDVRVVPPHVYCYRTLADAECHAAPLADGGTRLVGFEGLAPPHVAPAHMR